MLVRDGSDALPDPASPQKDNSSFSVSLANMSILILQSDFVICNVHARETSNPGTKKMQKQFPSILSRHMVLYGLHS